MRGSKKKLKDIFSKKVSLIVLVTLVISSILIPNIISRAEEGQTNTRVTKVLEIQPGNKFVFSKTKVNNMEFTCIDMPTFISMSDELYGKYDVIYIGNKISGGNSTLSKDWKLNSAYRQYSAPFQQSWDKLDTSLFTDDNWKDYGNTLWYGTMGGVEKNNQFWDNLYQTKYGVSTKYWNESDRKNKNVKINEYYSENDITNKRAKEILKLIEAGQLVYIDESIHNLDETKLMSNFDIYYNQNDSNVKFIKDQLSTSTIEDDFKKVNMKRPVVNMIKIPVGDGVLNKKGEYTFSSSKGDFNKRNMEFEFEITTPSSSDSSVKYEARLFLDYNGDGMYKGVKDKNTNSYPAEDVIDKNTEYVYKLEGVSVNKVTKLSYKLDPTFIGYLDWKLEIIAIDGNGNSVKDSEYGNAVYQNVLDTKIDYKVLQLTPNDITKRLILKDNNKFMTLLNSCGDYNFIVDKRSIKELNDEKVDLSNYDMIIVGFQDSYGGREENEFTEKSINKLMDFYKANKSIMFTHDTMGLKLLGNSIVNNKSFGTAYNGNNSDDVYGKLTRSFIDIVGQLRYDSLFTKKDGSTGIHDSYKKGEYGIGATTFSNVKLYEATVTEKARAINNGQISSYPYKLTESKVSDPEYINIAATHTQWYQLNLENEDLVCWYNISGSKYTTGQVPLTEYNDGDSRNFYYTYSDENITYSGTGHSEYENSGSYPEDELKLFVNTIYKAMRGANNPPSVSNYDIGKNTVIDGQSIDVNCEEDYKYLVKVTDIDEIKGQDMTVYSETDKGNIVNILDDNNNAQIGTVTYKYLGEALYAECTIPSDFLINHISESIKITSYAKDCYLEESGSKSFTINVIDNSPPEIVHGINKVVDSKLNPDKYQNYNFKSWDSSNVGFNIDPVTDRYRPYMDVVPMAAYVSTYCSDTKLILTMSENFEVNDKESAYTDNKINDNISAPSVFIVDSSGNLVKLGTMGLVDNSKNKYSIDISRGQMAQYAKEGYVNLVVQYCGKTYNHEMEDNHIMKYENSIEIIRGNKDISKPFYFNVGYKELTEDLI